MADPDSISQPSSRISDPRRRTPGRAGRRAVTPAELGRWLEEQRPGIGERWLQEIRARGVESTEDGEECPVPGLLAGFVDLLVSFLPPGVGPWRGQVEPPFREAAELYGRLGAVRGLAAGEAVEEMQLLREAVLRFLFREPPIRSGAVLGFRELLRLNRLVDLAVTHASVGHTDALFFDLLHGTGVTTRPRNEALLEIQSQVRALAEERDRLLPEPDLPSDQRDED